MSYFLVDEPRLGNNDPQSGPNWTTFLSVKPLPKDLPALPPLPSPSPLSLSPIPCDQNYPISTRSTKREE